MTDALAVKERWLLWTLLPSLSETIYSLLDIYLLMEKGPEHWKRNVHFKHTEKKLDVVDFLLLKVSMISFVLVTLLLKCRRVFYTQ